MENDIAGGLSAAELKDLRCVAGMMVPASTEYAVPGADDAMIFADIVKSLGRDLGDVRRALSTLSSLAGGAFAEQDAPRRETAAAAFRERGGAEVGDALARRSCNATTATTAWCARSDWSRGRHSRRDTRWSRVTGRCSTRCGRGRRCGATHPDAPGLHEPDILPWIAVAGGDGGEHVLPFLCRHAWPDGVDERMAEHWNEVVLLEDRLLDLLRDLLTFIAVVRMPGTSGTGRQGPSRRRSPWR